MLETHSPPAGFRGGTAHTGIPAGLWLLLAALLFAGSVGLLLAYFLGDREEDL